MNICKCTNKLIEHPCDICAGDGSVNQPPEQCPACRGSGKLLYCRNCKKSFNSAGEEICINVETDTEELLDQIAASEAAKIILDVINKKEKDDEPK